MLRESAQDAERRGVKPMPGIRDRLARSSEETSVMEVERRGKSSTSEVVTSQLQRMKMV
jgi:hypothetical protein